ncbi:SMI1/KNR4 family protein [Streptomyces fragilis]|uniref:SMI1/KNR4 family protein n=1 Tax=Streptomyces fragilis TaxID=67301 RepID=A0ABV2YN74_9ACTN|nr:SMI1/KNR4 family protein [Streptomyces fragilis]
MTDDRTFPEALAAVSRVAFPYDDGRGIDYEPYGDFLSAEETTQWFRAWTGNDDVDGDMFRVFGQQGAGGLVALWLVREGGATGRAAGGVPGVGGGDGASRPRPGRLPVAAGAGDGPDGRRPRGGAADGERAVRPHPGMTAVAQRFAAGRRRAPEAILRDAAEGVPDLEETVLALCR